MLFNSYEFLFLFLPIVLAGYYLLVRARTARLVFLTLLSYLFYGWWDYRFCALMLVSTLIDYAAGLGMQRWPQRPGRRLFLLFSLISNLALLGFFKYWDLLAGTANGLLSFARVTDQSVFPILRIILPVGISFYTFQSMSYSIDVYRGAVKPVRDFWTFACYVSLFPQLVAGPIIRYKDLADQLVEHTHTWEKAARGATLFILGLTKKVILADGVVPLVTRSFGGSAMGFTDCWIGVAAYAMQIYFDFSGYSDMAVGLGLMMGFEFPQNFNSPYKAVSITDFWRRWHMSLSTWLRDYLYVPLGGNRRGPWRTYANLFLTMLLGGLWHGANWTFVIWGGYHGILLAVERGIGKRGLAWWAPVWMQRAVAFILVLFSWVLFRCGTPGQAQAMFAGMLGSHGWGTPLRLLGADQPLALAMLGLAAVLAFGAPNTWEIKWRYRLPLAVALCLLLLVCVMTILVNSSSPFLYFQF